MERRRFLRTCGLLSTAAMLPRVVKAMPAGIAPGGRVLVVVQLTGGNDGLNTIIPYRNDVYHRERPGIAIAPGRVLPIDGEHGMHPALAGLMRLYDEGMVRVVQGVGLSTPDRSHFRSMDAWHMGGDRQVHGGTGWLGRHLDSMGLPAHALLELSGQLSLANRGANARGLAVRDPEAFVAAARQPFVARLAGVGALPEHPTAAFLHRTAAALCESADHIAAHMGRGRLEATWPRTGAARQLATVARLLRGGLDTRIYYTSVDGFDTHVNQPERHRTALAALGNALAAFMDEMKRAGLQDEVVVLVFSEFGRRVRQNSNQGTDHGTAGPVLLIGGRIRGGLHNPAPSLTDLDGEGDPRHLVDHREVYATVLERWLGGDATAVLGARHAPLQGLFN